MIYLILSSAFIDRSDISKGYEPILKIGYTGESSRKSRFDTYITENPTINVLYLIEGGTEIDELNLHRHFNHLKKDYGREWFRYDQEIIDFFETHKTKESLKDLKVVNYSEYKLKELKREILPKSNNENLFKLNYIISNIIEKYFLDSRKDIVECNKVYNSLLNDLIINFHQLTDYLSENYPEVDDIGEIDIPKEICSHLDELYSYKYLPDKLRYLCSLEESVANSLLPHLPESFNNYYVVLGPDRMRALRFDATDMKKAYEGIIGNQSIDIETLIIDTFTVGEKYTKTEIKKKLKHLYDSVGYSKTPKAVDLGDYFIIKTVDIKNEETGKRDKGYLIVSIKEETIKDITEP